MCFLMKPEKRGFKHKKHRTGTITDSTAKRLFDNKIITVNDPITIYNRTLNTLFLNSKAKTIRMLQAIARRQAKILGFNNVPTGYGAPCNNCIMPMYVSLNETANRIINVTAYDSFLKKWNDKRATA